MRSTLENLPCKWCGQEVLANPNVIFGAYHRDCWTKFLTAYVEMWKKIDEGAYKPSRHEHEQGAPLGPGCDQWCRFKHENWVRRLAKREQDKEDARTG